MGEKILKHKAYLSAYVHIRIAYAPTSLVNLLGFILLSNKYVIEEIPRVK